MKNKKGFTLIELLAVIVILAIIALIATPIILNIIDDTRDSSQLRGAELYLDTVTKSIAAAQLNTSSIPDGEYTIMSNGHLCKGTIEENACTGIEIKVEVRNTIPTGTVVIKSGDVVATNGTSETILNIDGKTIKYNEKGELAIVSSTGGSSTPAVTYNIGDEVHLAGTTTLYKDYANSGDPQPTCTQTETLDYTVWNVVNVSGDNITLYAGDFAAIGDSSFSRRTSDSNASTACYDKFKIIIASAVDISDVTYGGYPISIPTASDLSNIITVSGSTYTLNNSGYTWFDRQTHGSGVALNDLGDSTNPYTYVPGGQLFFNQEGPGASVYRPIMTLTKTQLAGLVK